MKVCFVRRYNNFRGVEIFFILFLGGCRSKRCRLLSNSRQKMLSKLVSLMLAMSSNRVSGNGPGLAEGGAFQHCRSFEKLMFG